MVVSQPRLQAAGARGPAQHGLHRLRVERAGGAALGMHPALRPQAFASKPQHVCSTPITKSLCTSPQPILFPTAAEGTSQWEILAVSDTILALFQVEYIRRHDRLGGNFHRRWDQQSRYNEAAALHRQLMKAPKEPKSGAMKAP